MRPEGPDRRITEFHFSARCAKAGPHHEAGPHPMHDIRSIRENPAAFDQGLRNRGMEPLSAQMIALDDRRKSAISALQAATETRNALSKEIGQAKGRKDEARAQELMAQVSALKESLPQLEREERAAEKEL